MGKGFLDFLYEDNTTPAKNNLQQDQNNKSTITFPNVNSQQNSTTTLASPTSNPHLESVIGMYQKGFDSLNMPGPDFFEFFKTIMKSGADNKAAYTVAFDFIHGMDSSLTKDKLIEQANFYVNEITKVHSDTASKGSAKQVEINNLKTTEQQSLTNLLSNLKQQMEALTTQINDTSAKLGAIDSKYQPQLNDAALKLEANDYAKNKLVTEIEKVKQGISNNI